jgi:hypothetical protein
MSGGEKHRVLPSNNVHAVQPPVDPGTLETTPAAQKGYPSTTDNDRSWLIEVIARRASGVCAVGERGVSYVPPLRVAAVADKGVGIIDDPKAEDADWTLIDGLQRTTCYIIAVLMAAFGNELVDEDCIDEGIWNETFRQHAEACDVNKLLL